MVQAGGGKEEINNIRSSETKSQIAVDCSAAEQSPSP
jgi:hypothetical protein